MTDLTILAALVPVLAMTVFFTILIVARIYATSLPFDRSLAVTDDEVDGLQGMS